MLVPGAWLCGSCICHSELSKILPSLNPFLICEMELINPPWKEFGWIKKISTELSLWVVQCVFSSWGGGNLDSDLVTTENM